MQLFSAEERELAKTQIIEYAKIYENILSAVLVGSGSVEFTDDASDIDLYIIVNDKENILDAMKHMKECIEQQYHPLFFKQMNARGLQIYLLQNYLEIDIGYAAINEAEADNERFKVMFDKNNVTRLMNESCQKNSEATQAMAFDTVVLNKYTDYAETTWHYLFHSAVAVKRKQYWRCMAEMDIVRNRIIELKGYKYSLETKRWRDVDKFPKEEITDIRKTLVTKFTQKALLQNLLSLTNFVYDELELYPSNIAVNRQHVITYISNTIKA